MSSKWRAVTEKMKELEYSHSEAWGQVKETADQLWEELKSGVVQSVQQIQIRQMFPCWR